MELDDIKTESWRKLIAATSEYCSRQEVAAQFDQLAELLTAGQTSPAKQPGRWMGQPATGAGAGSGSLGQQQQQQQPLGTGVTDRQPFAGPGIVGSLGKLNFRKLRAGAQDRMHRQAAGSPAAIPDQINKRQRTNAVPGRQDVDSVQHVEKQGLGAVGAGVSAGRSAEGLAAPKLLYQKGVLLVEAPRNVAAAAAAAAGAASAGALGSVRQQQQQELVGRMLAAALPQQLLQVCNLSALTAAGTAVAAAASRDRMVTPFPGQQQQQQGVLQRQQQSSPAVAAAAAAGSASLPPVQGKPGEGRGSGQGTLSLSATNSPRASSWLDYIFPWQSSPSAEQLAGAAEAAHAAAAGVSDSRGSSSGGGTATAGECRCVYTSWNQTMCLFAEGRPVSGGCMLAGAHAQKDRLL